MLMNRVNYIKTS